jgi:hypothetical protein
VAKGDGTSHTRMLGRRERREYEQFG